MGLKTTLMIYVSVLSLSVNAQARAAATADRISAPAKGEHSCFIFQTESRLITAHYDDALSKMSGARRTLGVSAHSHLKFRVFPNGSVSAGGGPNMMPGSILYLMIAGKRYSGPIQGTPLDARAVTALQQDQTMDYTFTRIDGGESSFQDQFDGFAGAYRDCMAFISKKR